MSPHPTWSLLGCASLAAAAFCGGCSSSSSGGGGGVDAGHSSSSGGSQSDDGSATEAGEGGGDGGAGVCKVPAGAEMMTYTEAGVIGCSATTSNTLCDPQFRLLCRAPDPITGVPVPPSSLGCNLQVSSDPTMAVYCCPCQ